MEQVQRECTEKKMIKGVVIPTLIRGTAEEENDKALRSLEANNFALKKEIEKLKRQTRRLDRISVEIEKWLSTAMMVIAVVDIAIVIALFFALTK
ncbi:hypothetical protein HMPREF9970_1679 [Lachnoanaerobaculum saburreum F0468]|uniref:Uncharacterized protein n=1 Tax=Lachnoanaerobaculum saburreum F0468 TaxID=1095750 RepID=I0R768_9FIRM|nr:hypothetical protein [Lachnoanaerobaculum saburreum]EIC95526.1 hypothetical protein HMPREF9970_1679 [Lachnoanaerobaculum saburreum F0468]